MAYLLLYPTVRQVRRVKVHNLNESFLGCNEAPADHILTFTTFCKTVTRRVII